MISSGIGDKYKEKDIVPFRVSDLGYDRTVNGAKAERYRQDVVNLIK